MKYRKKPFEIEAWQYTGNNGWQLEQLSDIIKTSPVLEPTEDNPTGEYIQVNTKYGWKTAIVGDYIIKQDGKFYIMKEELFNEHYEPKE